jgi:hypothetical protein
MKTMMDVPPWPTHKNQQLELDICISSILPLLTGLNVIS